MTKDTKEIRLRQNTSRRIVAAKISQARVFLECGHHVRFLMPYRSGESDLEEQRLRLLGRVTLSLQDVSAVEQQPEQATSRTMTMLLKPLEA